MPDTPEWCGAARVAVTRRAAPVRRHNRELDCCIPLRRRLLVQQGAVRVAVAGSSCGPAGCHARRAGFRSTAGAERGCLRQVGHGVGAKAASSAVAMDALRLRGLGLGDSRVEKKHSPVWQAVFFWTAAVMVFGFGCNQARALVRFREKVEAAADYAADQTGLQGHEAALRPAASCLGPFRTTPGRPGAEAVIAEGLRWSRLT